MHQKKARIQTTNQRVGRGSQSEEVVVTGIQYVKTKYQTDGPKGSQPPVYEWGLSLSTRVVRVGHFRLATQIRGHEMPH